MLKYILVENRQTVHLGPIFWSTRRFQSDLDDQEVAVQVPVADGYVKLNDVFEIFPIIESTIPLYDGLYQGLAGPYYTYSDTSAIEHYNVVDLELWQVRDTVKNLAAAKRYSKENEGLMVTVQGQQVFLDTQRENRNIFIQKYLLMGDAETSKWKFPEGWLHLTKADLAAVIMQGAMLVQGAFDWEESIVSAAAAASSVAELQAIIETNKLLEQNTGKQTG